MPSRRPRCLRIPGRSGAIPRAARVSIPGAGSREPGQAFFRRFKSRSCVTNRPGRQSEVAAGGVDHCLPHHRGGSAVPREACPRRSPHCGRGNDRGDHLHRAPDFPARSQHVLDLHLWWWPQCVGMFCLGALVSRHHWAERVPPGLARRCGIAMVVILVVAPLFAVALGVVDYTATAYGSSADGTHRRWPSTLSKP